MAAHTLLVAAILCFGVLGMVVSTHASKRDRNGPFWFVLVTLTGLLGLAVYAAVVAMGRDDADPVEVEDPIPTTED